MQGSPLNQHIQRVEETPEAPSRQHALSDQLQEARSTSQPNPLKLITCTPIFYRKATSPIDLKLDSEGDSSAGWSFSMATPTNRNIVQESPISMATTTTTEDEYCSTDESVLELRKILKTESRENRSRINSKRLLIKGGKSVARALFPASTSHSLSEGKSLGVVSPLVRHCAALKSSCNSPALTKIDENDLVCSQEMFESPVDTVLPNGDECDNGDENIMQAEPIQCIPASPTEVSAGATPLNINGEMKCFDVVGRTPNIPHDVHHFVHSTPLSSKNTKSTFFDNSTRKAISVPEVPLIAAHEPSPENRIINSPTALVKTSLCDSEVAETPYKSNNSQHLSSFSTIEDDFLDVLFMSSSQLENHISLHSNLGPSEHDVPGSHLTSLKITADKCDKPHNNFLYPASKQLKSRVRNREAVGADIEREMEGCRDEMISISDEPWAKKKCVDGRDEMISISDEPWAKKKCVDGSMEGCQDCIQMEESELVHEVTDGVTCVFEGSDGDSDLLSTKEVRCCGVSNDQGDVNKVDDSFDEVIKTIQSPTFHPTTIPSQIQNVSSPPPPPPPPPPLQLSSAVNQLDKYEKNGNVNVLDKMKISPIPVKRPIKTPGLRGLKLTNISTDRHIDSFQQQPMSSPQPTIPEAEVSCLGFKTASGSSIAVSAAALERARKIMTEEETKTFSELCKDQEELPSATGQGKNETMGINSKSFSVSSLRSPGVVSKPCSSFSPVSYPRVKARPRRCQQTKSFKAPRMASEVSEKEERASLSRILKSFGVSGEIKQNRKVMDTRSHLTCANTECSNPKGSVSFQTAKLERLAENKENLLCGMENQALACPVPINGFKTASGNDITVSSAAMTRAKEITKEEDGIDTQFCDKNAMFDFHSGSDRDLMVTPNSSLSKVIASTPKKSSDTLLEKFNVTGFKTAGGRSISISEKSLQRAHDIVNACQDDNEKGRQEELKESKPHSLSSMSGFKTAGGRGITISKKFLEEADRKMKECDNDTESRNNSQEDHHSTSKDINALKVTPHLPQHSLSDQHSETVHDTELFSDSLRDESDSYYFSTQFVKQLLDFSSEEDDSPDVSAVNDHFKSESITKAEIIEETCCSDEREPMVAEEGNITILDPASRIEKSTSTISCQEPSKKTSVSDDIPSEMIVEENMDVFTMGLSCSELGWCGDESGQGVGQLRQLSVQDSDADIVETSDLELVDLNSQLATSLSTVHDLDDNSTSGFPGLQTASGKEVKVRDESIRAAKIALGEGQQHSTTSFPGLQTASGKEVKVIDESIRAAKIALGERQQHSTTSFPGLQTASGKEVKVRDESIRAAKIALGEGQQHPTTSFPGLQTASGKEVKVRDESIRAAKIALGGGQQHPTTSFPGLQTASGKEVKVRDESIRAAKIALGAQQHPTTSFPGLQTASGKEVKVRDESIRAAKTALGAQQHPTTSFPGLQTASGKEVKVRDESIRAAKIALGEGQQHPTTSFPGLQTASGKEVKVRDESIRAAKIALGEGQQHSITSFPGLQTASGKEMTVRDESIRAAKIALGDEVVHHARLSSERIHGGSNSSRGAIVPEYKTSLTRSTTLHSGRQITQRQPETRQLKKSLTAIPEGILFDRASSGKKRLVPLQSSNSDVKSTTTPATRSHHIPNVHTSQSQSRPIFRKFVPHHQPPVLNTTPVYPRISESYSSRDHYSSSSHRPSVLGCYTKPPSLAPTSLQASQSSNNHSRSNFGTSSSSSYTSGGRTNFATPIKGGSKNKYVCPQVWKTSVNILKDQADKPVQAGAEPPRPCEGVVRENPDMYPPLSPLQITLSQIFDSQDFMGVDEPGESTRHKPTTTTDDSGYISREVSALKSPSPFETEQNDKATVVTDTNEDFTDLLFAEVAMNTLDDSLSLDQTTLVQPNTEMLQDSCSPKYHDRTIQNPNSTENRQCIVKRQLGSLLELRNLHKSQRIAIKDVVGHMPPRRWSTDELCRFGVSNHVQAVRTDNVENFHFRTREYFSSSALSSRGSVCVGDGAMLSLNPESIGLTELWEAFRFSPGVDIKLISLEWFTNHFKSIVMKLASMEVTYPRRFAGRFLTPDWLMLQLKYRYDREIDNAERSSIHKICEHDDVPSRRMVLYVSKCYSTDTASSVCDSSRNDHYNKSMEGADRAQEETPPSIELSDGWYSLPCVLDRPLKHMLKRGKIRVGTKLILSGCELLCLNSPCHPLEVPASCCLRISANSTRRTRWFARLGYQPNPRPFSVPLESLFPDGGMVGCVNAVIARVYPLTYLEKRGDLKKMRCIRMEWKEEERHVREREQMIEEISSRIQKEFEKEMDQSSSLHSSRNRSRSRRLNTLQIKQLQDGEEIYYALINSPDPQSFQEILSSVQLMYLESYKTSLASERQAELQERINAAIKEEDERFPVKRNVTPLIKIRLVPPHNSTPSPGNLDCQLSYWRPDASLLQAIKEGTQVRLFNVIAKPMKHKHNSAQIQLTSTRSTRFETVSTPSDSCHYLPRWCTEISQLSGLSASEIAHREFDTVGLVGHLSTSQVVSRDDLEKTNVVDMICLADLGEGILVVKVWGGLKTYGLEDVVTVGAALSLSNLYYWGTGPGHPWPTAHLGDLTTVSQNPKETHLKTALTKFKDQLPEDRSHWMLEITDRIMMYL